MRCQMSADACRLVGILPFSRQWTVTRHRGSCAEIEPCHTVALALDPPAIRVDRSVGHSFDHVVGSIRDAAAACNHHPAGFSTDRKAGVGQRDAQRHTEGLHHSGERMFRDDLAWVGCAHPPRKLRGRARVVRKFANRDPRQTMSDSVDVATPRHEEDRWNDVVPLADLRHRRQLVVGELDGKHLPLQGVDVSKQFVCRSGLILGCGRIVSDVS